MSISNFLNSKQVTNLQKALSENESPYIRQRILILLLRNDGKTDREIIDFLGCLPLVVGYWSIREDPEHLLKLALKQKTKIFTTSKLLKTWNFYNLYPLKIFNSGFTPEQLN